MPDSNSQISAFLAERISAGDFPSAVYLIAQNGEQLFSDAVGNAVVQPQQIAATVNTIYDLASLTKPLITGLLSSRLIEKGELALDEYVSHYVPEFDGKNSQSITIRQLLTHSAGLPAWRPLYILAEGDPDRTLTIIANSQREYKPGTRVVYSDLGFITLGLLLERLTGKRISELAGTEILQPLQLKRTFFNPAQAMQTGIAACELGNGHERETCQNANPGQYTSWREELIWGQVHDGNAFFLGGAAGHAGLFADASDTLIIANQFLAARSELLKPETCSLFRSNMTAGLNEARSVSWQLAATRDSTAGAALPLDSFGHTGFTGTSCWIDPNNERVFILLTNRTHAHSLPFTNINSVRRQFHSMSVEALEGI
ncbi:MAG TPA: serine hydrolase domain-containing protein [Pyrinomonadaceae bacterium]|nr:serine hydrolase domain-containing protein [Pyrinomonadaceae bacterium]